MLGLQGTDGGHVGHGAGDVGHDDGHVGHGGGDVGHIDGHVGHDRWRSVFAAMERKKIQDKRRRD